MACTKEDPVISLVKCKFGLLFLILCVCVVLLALQEKVKQLAPIQDATKALIAWGSSTDVDHREKQMHRANVKRKMSKVSLVGYVCIHGAAVCSRALGVTIC